jgi:hypothetical protein
MAQKVRPIVSTRTLPVINIAIDVLPRLKSQI